MVPAVAAEASLGIKTLPDRKKQWAIPPIMAFFTMPTTLTLDDDLAGLLRTAAQQTGQPEAEMAFSLLRAALGKPRQALPASTPFRIRPHHGVFAPNIQLQKLNQLADELDMDAFLARQKS